MYVEPPQHELWQKHPQRRQWQAQLRGDEVSEAAVAGKVAMARVVVVDGGGESGERGGVALT